MHHRGAVSFDETMDFYDEVEPTDLPAESAFATFASSRFANERPILVEAPFELRIGEATLAGRIDAVYQPDPSAWEIVDFKSGRNRPDPARRVQLEAYAVAADEARLDGRDPPETVSVTFAYFGGGAVEEVSEVVDGEWLDAARRHLGDLMEGAERGPYDPNPGVGCHSCDFARFCDAGTAWLEGQR